MIDNAGTTKGINISVYRTRGDKKYSGVDIARVLKKFKLNETLKFIGELSFKILSNKGESIIKIQGVPVSDSVLAYLAMVAIENSNDYRKESITIENIVKVTDMYFGMPDPYLTDHMFDQFLLRFGSAQFDYDRELNNITSRTILIYGDLWKKTAEARHVDIEAAMEDISGLKIEESLILAYAYFGASKHGFVRMYDPNDIKPEKDRSLFTHEKQICFLKWIACTYQQFRTESSAKAKELPSSDYERNRFNPLVKHPVISPDCNPVPNRPQVYLVPIPRLLLERLTRGLYFDLSDYFRGEGKENKFREAFGPVFQKYVGHLLKKSQIKGSLLPEWDYNKGQKRTVDWILIENDRATLIEVKQSGLFLQAKTTGELPEVRNSLRMSIAAAVRQLWSLERDIESGKFPEIECLANVKHIERLVITYDRTYYSNSLLKKEALGLAHEKDNSIPDDYFWHTTSVEEFEYILGMDNLSLFDFLRTKKEDQEAKEWDFREYRARKFAEAQFLNPYLESVKRRFLAQIDASLDEPNISST